VSAPVGILLAAGEGRRLRPLTLARPKPLVPVLGVPVLEIALRQLEALGCRTVAVNGHHLAPRLAAWLAARAAARPETELRFFDEPELLGTGGGLRRMLRELPPGEALVQNGDVVHDLDLAALLAAARARSEPLALVAAGQPPALRVEGGRVAALGRGEAPNRGFACIHWLAAEGRALLAADGDRDVVADYRRLLARGVPLAALEPAAEPLWVDIGSLPRYLPLQRELAADGRFAALLARLGLRARWDPATGCSVAEGSRLPEDARGCVAWEGVEWRGSARDSLLLDGVRGAGRLNGEIVL